MLSWQRFQVFACVHETGNGNTGAFVNTYIDGMYLGTNNVFAPSRGARLWIGLEYASPLYVTAEWRMAVSVHIVGVTESHRHAACCVAAGTGTPTTGAVVHLAMASHTRRQRTSARCPSRPSTSRTT
jgi:hypothetical protein